MTVDVERLTSAWLRGDAAVQAIVEQRVYTEVPALKEGVEEWRWPLVRVNQYGGAPVFSRPLYLDTGALQIDCFGGPKKITRDLADAIRARLEQMVGSHDSGVVTAVEFGEMRYLPDASYNPAKPRWVVDCVIYSHP